MRGKKHHYEKAGKDSKLWKKRTPHRKELLFFAQHLFLIPFFGTAFVVNKNDDKKVKSEKKKKKKEDYLCVYVYKGKKFNAYQLGVVVEHELKIWDF